MAEIFQISRSGYYAGRKRPISRRDVDSQLLVKKIQIIHQANRRVYGSPRITAELCAQGVACSLNRVARLMKANQIAARTKRKFKVTTRSKHQFPVASNLLDQVITADHPNRVWVSDITYIPTDEGWLYQAMVKDLHSKAVVGMAMGDRLHRSLVMNAFKRRRPLPGLIFHSDRGVQ